jgi:YegS/Rv2252/BmrU family lipid kinase
MRAPFRRVLVVANPMAGLKRGRPAGEAALAAARRAGTRAELHRTSGPGDGERAAAAAAGEGFDLVLAAGGDGTAHEVANGVAGTAAAMGVAPAGTMNLLARVIGLPLDPAQAAFLLVASGSRRTVRPGRANGRLFVLMAGTGFDAWVLRALLAGATGKLAFGDYVRGAIRGLATFPFPRLTVEGDAGSPPAHTVIIGRAPLYGGFLRPTPHARLDGDALELCALAGGAARLASALPRMWSGAHGDSPGVTLAPVRRAVVRADRDAVPFQLDGELVGTLPLEVDLAELTIQMGWPAR